MINSFSFCAKDKKTWLRINGEYRLISCTIKLRRLSQSCQSVELMSSMNLKQRCFRTTFSSKKRDTFIQEPFNFLSHCTPLDVKR